MASDGSFVKGCNIYVIGAEGFPPGKKVMKKAIFTAWNFIWKNRNKYDLIHNFGRLLYLLPVLNHRIQKIMCYQREITLRNISIFNKLPNKNIIYCGCSNDLIKRANAPGKWAAVHNAVDFNQFTLTENLPLDAPLIFLGRIEKIKGCHTAIEVAKKTNHQLIIAGNISPLIEEMEYFEKEIKPQIDGIKIVYIGEVNDIQKNAWLGKAKALLMPIEWNEPFGIVMIEAMACGTAVIGFNKGAVPEVIKNGVTGFLVNNKEEMISALDKINNVKRKIVRNVSEKEFDVEIVANKYLQLFSE